MQFSAIGTEWEITIPSISQSKETDIKEKILERIEIFDVCYSRFRPDSLISQMARESGEYILPEDAKPLLDLYQKLYSATDGLVTPLIGQVLSDAGYDAKYSLVPKELSTPPSWDETLVYDFPRLTLLQPALLDFGAAGKGYLVDIIAALLDHNGISHYIVDAGGDIRCNTIVNAPCIVGLEDPTNPSRVLGTVQIAKGSICGSAGNRRAWKGYHHIINPKTLQSPLTISAVWVRSAEAMIADALTTCLYLLPPEAIIEKISNFAEFFILNADYSYIQSANFNAELFT